MSGEKSAQNRKWGKIAVLVCLIVVLALLLQVGILYDVNTRNVNKTSRVLLNQVIGIIEENQQNEKEMIESLKEDYIVRAKAVAYIIDANPEAQYDQEELQKIAELMSVDEIHLFDERGKIYSGSVPKYYGYNFDSGEQMAYFKPMLDDKNLAMCQDVTPNTSEGKKMMYAITWNEAGKRMVQVGVEPVRLLREVKQNEVPAVVGNMPVYEGISIYVADQKTGEIYGATDTTKVGITLDELGVPAEEIGEKELFKAHITIDGEAENCIFQRTGDYIIGVTFTISSDNESNLAVILLLAVYLALASAVILFMLSRVFKANREKNEQFAVLASMSEIYHRMYLVDLETDSVIAYSSREKVEKTGKWNKNADDMMHRIMKETAIEAYREQADLFADLHTVAERMKGKKIISGEFVGRELGWFRASFIMIEADLEKRPRKMIFTIQSIDSEKRKEEKLIHTSNTDTLTGCYNRRAYEKDLADLSPVADFIYLSMDVNGLKIVNDSQGHGAGDELLQGAASCMKKCFDSCGKVYRTGGDEFIAILFTDQEHFQKIMEEFEETVNRWTGKEVERLAVSCGFVSSREEKWTSMEEITRTSDMRMYEEKAMYYRKNGVDRRGQPAAYIALCKLYPRILKADLTEDSCRTLNREEEKGRKKCLSTWLQEFKDQGAIHPDDLAEYQEKTDLAYLRNCFDNQEKAVSISYRKKDGGRSALEIVPAEDYSEKKRVVFLYIKG